MPLKWAWPIPESFFDFDKNKDNLTKEELKCMCLINCVAQS